MPITIARFGQTEQCGWTKYALFGWNGRRNKELIGLSSSLKAVGFIMRTSCNDSAWWDRFHCGKNTARAEGSELSTSIFSKVVQQSRPAAFWVQKAAGSIKRAERSYQQYFQLPWFSVLLASAFIGTNDERSPRNSSSRDFNRKRDKTGRISQGLASIVPTWLARLVLVKHYLSAS